MSKKLFFLMYIPLAILMYSRMIGAQSVVTISKAITSVMFILTAICAIKESKIQNKKYAVLLLLGFCFCTMGDICIEFESLFIIGIVGPALAHISDTIAYFLLGPVKKENLIVSVIILTICLVTINGYSGFDFGSLKPAVYIYTIIISIMVGKSFSILEYKDVSKKTVCLTLAGSLLFFISDYILIFSIFIPSKPVLPHVIDNLIYYTGQGLLALSLKYQIEFK